MKILLAQETDWLKRNPHQQHHLADNLSLREHKVRVIDYELLWQRQRKKELFSRRQVFPGVSKTRKGVSVTLIRPGIIKIPCLDYISLLFSHKREIKRQIREFAPDVIVGFGILNSYSASRAVRRSRIPFIYYWIDVLHLLIPTRPFRIIGKLVESAALKRSDKVLVINDRLKDLVVGMGAPEERTHVLRAGIDLRQFDTGIDGNVIRKRYGIDERDVVLFFMGFLYQFAGLKEVALKLAETGNSRLKLLIVGEGDAYNELKEIQDKYKLEDRIVLTDKKPYHEIPGFIAASDICLLPSYPWEPIMQDIVPIKMYEYMAMGKPVIATRLPGIVKELGEDNGVVYIDRPEDAVAKAVELWQNGRVEELGSKARAFVEGNSWDKITDAFQKILEQAIEEKRNERLSKQV